MARIQPQIPHDFPDRVIRDALRQSANLRELIARLFPELVEQLDFQRMHEVPRQFLLDDYRERESDLLVEVSFRDRPDALPLLICLLVEHQSTVDNAMPLRLLLYAVLYWESQWRAWSAGHPHGQPLRLTPVLPVVLYTGSEPWDGNRSLADMFPDHESLRAFAPQWQTCLCDLTTFSTEDLVHSPAAFWQALAVVRSERAPQPEYRRIIEEVSRQLATIAEQDRPRWDQLLKLVLYWSIYRRARGEHAELVNVVRACQSSTLLQQEVQKMSEQTWLNWEQEIAITAAQKATEQAGQAKDAEFTRKQRALLLTQLEQRFQVVPTAVREKIEAANLEKVEAALTRVVLIHAPEDLTF
jgi:Putative transposase, YhgA-like